MKKYLFLIITLLYAIVMLLTVLNIIDIGSPFMLILIIIYFVCAIIEIATVRKSQKR